MSKVNIVLDASQYDTFLLCPERYNNRYNKNKVLPTKEKRLDRGTLVHAACEYYYQGLKDGKGYEDSRIIALSKIREVGASDSDLEVEEISRIVDVMEENFDYWKVADSNLVIEEVEQSFMYLLYEDDNVRIYMSGKIDLLWSDHKNFHKPMDHKSYDRDYGINDMSNQFKNYCNAVKSDYLLVNRIGFQKTLKAADKFKRVPVQYDELALEQWRKNVINQILHHYLTCVAENYWPMNETSCDKYHRQCEYLPICKSSGEPAKLFKLNNLYNTIEPWDVTKVLRKSSEVVSEANLGVKDGQPYSQTEEA